MTVNFTSPIGRLVQGDAFEMQTKDADGNLRVYKSGPDIGKPNPQLFMALAFAKNDPAWPAFERIILGAAAASWPTFFPAGALLPGVKFATKIVDGDGYDTKGKANATKEGHAGHWVVRFTSGYAAKAYRQTNPGVTPPVYVELQPTDKDENGQPVAKRGYYYRIAGSIKSNASQQQPGMHVNIGLIELVGRGPEIVSGPDAATAFGGQAVVALPPGAQPLGAGLALPGAPAAAPPLPPGPVTALAAPVAPIAPPPVQPPPYDGYRAAAAPAGPVMLPAAQGATYEAMLTAGWTDATLIQHGMMEDRVPY